MTKWAKSDLEMASGKKILENAFAQFLGKALTVLASFWVIKILTGFGPEFYGQYVTAYEFLAFFGILADGGLFAIAVREISKKNTPKNAEFVLGNIFSIRLILIICATILAGVAAHFVPNFSPLVRTGIWITGVSMALTIFAGTLSAILQARMKIHFFAGSLVAGKIILAILIFVLAQQADFFGQNLFFAFLFAGVFSNFIFLALVYFFARREMLPAKIRPKFNRDYWKKTIQNSLPLGLALVLQTLYLRLDLILISAILGAGAVGIYGVSARIIESFLILGVFFAQAFLPKISAETQNQKNSETALNWATEKLLILALPIVIGLFFFAREIVETLSGKEFLGQGSGIGADGSLQILALAVVFAFLNQVFAYTLMARNAQKFLIWTNAAALFLNGFLNLLFLPKYGIAAAAVSTVACEILVLALLFVKLRSDFSIKIFTPNFQIILFANIFLAFLYFLGLPFFVAIILAPAIYFSFFWVLRHRFGIEKI